MSRAKIEKEIEKIERQILSEDTIQNLLDFKESLKAINNVMSSITRRDKKKHEYSLSDLLDEIDVQAKDVVQVPLRVNPIHAAYIILGAKKNKQCTTPFGKNTITWDGKKGNRNWAGPVFIELKGKHIICYHYPSVFAVNAKCRYIVVHEQHSQIDQYTMLCAKDDIQKCMDHFNKIKNSNAIFHNSYISVGERDRFDIKEALCKFQLKDVTLSDDIRIECELISKMLKQYDPAKPFKSSICFYGEPGTGKTTSIQAVTQLALQAGATVFSCDSMSSYNTTKHLYDLFQLASDHLPALIILEDIDLIAGDRKGSSAVTSEMLQLFSGSNETNGIIVLMTTNDFGSLDKAMTRRGRIDRLYRFDYPTKAMKTELIKTHAKHYGVKLSEKELLKAFEPIIQSGVSTGADISSAIYSATQRASTEGGKVCLSTLKWAIGSYQRLQSSRIGY